MSKHRAMMLMTLLVVPLLSSCDASNQLSTVAGTVSVDGTPVETGTIHFQSKTSSASSGGSIVTDGKFEVVSKDGFTPGEYAVALQAFRKTGRTINDPQKGKVELTASVPLADSPKAVELSESNAVDLNIEFSAME